MAKAATGLSYHLDYEADRPNTYEVVVTVTDSQTSPGPQDLTDSTLVVITVTNVDEPPVFANTTITRHIVEGTGVRAVGLPVVATDPEGQAVTYKVTTDDGR